VDVCAECKRSHTGVPLGVERGVLFELFSAGEASTGSIPTLPVSHKPAQSGYLGGLVKGNLN